MKWPGKNCGCFIKHFQYEYNKLMIFLITISKISYICYSFKEVCVKFRPNFKRFIRVVLTSLLYTLFILIWYYLLVFLFNIDYPFLAFFLVLIAVLFFHDQLTWRIRNFIDKKFYRRIFAVTQSLNRFNIELNSTLDFQLIIKKFTYFMKETFADHSWVFYYCWGQDYEMFASHQVNDSLPQLIQLPGDRVLNEIFNDEIDFFSINKLLESDIRLKQAMNRFPGTDNLAYFFPLKSYKGYLGFLLLDRKFRYYLHYHSLNKLIRRVFKKTADVLENDFLYSEVERKSLQNLLLVEIGKKISSSLDLNEVLGTIIDSVTQLVSYDAGGIFLVDQEDNILRRMITRGYDKNLLAKLSLKLDKGIYGWVIRNKQPSIINDVGKDPNYYQVRKETQSQLTVPLTNGDTVLGVMALESDKINHFTPADRELLMTFASQAVIAIENAELFEASLQKKRLESELIIASKVQKALLPERPPDFPGLKISFLNIPSQIVGGDFYDVFKLDDGKLAIAIGDVSGKGAPASILMAMLYAGFRSLLKVIYPVVEVVARLNNLLTDTTAEGYFATFFFGIYDKNSGEYTYTNAGHNAPILLRGDDSVERLEKGGVVLGFLNNQEYHQEKVLLRSGDYLVLFTDGVTEVKNSEGEEFGEERLVDFIRDNRDKKPHRMRTLLFEEIRKFSSQAELEDDATLVIVYVE